MFVAKNKDKSLSWLQRVWIHDLRRTASTYLHETGWPSDIIEKALAHSISGVRGEYNRAECAGQRRRMSQQCADFVGTLKSGAKFTTITSTA